MFVKQKGLYKRWFFSYMFICSLVFFAFKSVDATVPEDQTVQGETILWVDTNISDPNVWVIVKTPECREIKKILIFNQGRYEATYNFDYPGHYEVIAYIQDPNGQVYKERTNYMVMDIYEPDNSPQQPNFVPTQAAINSIHNFHDSNDVDWIICLLFKAETEGKYQIEIEKKEEGNKETDSNRPICQWEMNCPLWVDLCYLDGNLVLDPYTNEPLFHAKYHYMSGIQMRSLDTSLLPHSDFYLLKFYYGCPDGIPSETSTLYSIRRFYLAGAGTGNGFIWGYVVDSQDKPIPSTIHVEGNNNLDIPDRSNDPDDGLYLRSLGTGDYKVYASATCYQESQKDKIEVTNMVWIRKDFKLSQYPNCYQLPETSGDVPGDFAREFIKNQPILGDKPVLNNVPVTLYPGLNLFSPPGYKLGVKYDSYSFLYDVYEKVYEYYDPNVLFFNFKMKMGEYDSKSNRWCYCSLYVSNGSDFRYEGENFALNPYKSYLVYINPNISSNIDLKDVSIEFECIKTYSPFNLISGINPIGFSYFPDKYNSTFLFRDPDLGKELIYMLYYNSQKGSFCPSYRFFGKPSGIQCQLNDSKGYILFMKDSLDGWGFF